MDRSRAGGSCVLGVSTDKRGRWLSSLGIKEGALGPTNKWIAAEVIVEVRKSTEWAWLCEWLDSNSGPLP